VTVGTKSISSSPMQIASDIFYSLQFPQYYWVVANPLADSSLFLMMEIIVC
jgi:hypothetical protein